MGFLKNQTKKLLKYLPPHWVCKLEYRRQCFQNFNERPVEIEFVFRQIAAFYPSTILDVGSGRTALPHLMRNCGPVVTASDNIRDYWSVGMTNRHYHVIDDDITDTQLNGNFDLITCISVLEHIVNHQDAVVNMLGLLNPGGHLILTCPYTENRYVDNVYANPDSDRAGQKIPYICQSFSRKELAGWLAAGDGEVVEQEYWKFWESDIWRVGQQVIPPKKVTSRGRHQLTCLLIRKSGE